MSAFSLACNETLIDGRGLVGKLFAGLRRICAHRGGRGTLVIQPLPGIGDMVWHLPHLHALADVEGPLTLLAKPRSQAVDLFINDPSVARILSLERRPGHHDGLWGFIRLVRELRRERFNSAWLFHGSTRYAWALLLAGIPRTTGYGRGLQRYLLSTPVTLPPERLEDHPIAKADLLLRLTGLTPAPEPRLRLDAVLAQKLRERYQACPRPWIAFGIGSSEPYKQWGAARFAALAIALGGEYGASVFLLGGPGERALGEAIFVAGQAASVSIIHPAQSVAEAIALLTHCRLFIGNDTGALNMAAALGVPALGLFGGSRPLSHSPHIWALLPGAGQGMDGITVEQVLVAARSLLEDRFAG